MMPSGAIVVAAGAGERLGRGPKALVRLGGKTLLAWVLATLAQLPEVEELVVVARAQDEPAVEREVRAALPGRPGKVVLGGATRQASVAAGLRALGEAQVVLVHDVARPLASPALFRSVLIGAEAAGAAIPALPVREALKAVKGGRIEASVSREGLFSAQTPQGFRTDLLRQAHLQARGHDAADDSELVSRLGAPVEVLPGEVGNLKVTYAEDLEWLEALLAARRARA